jgi:hypothetical protein
MRVPFTPESDSGFFAVFPPLYSYSQGDLSHSLTCLFCFANGEGPEAVRLLSVLEDSHCLVVIDERWAV